MTVAKNTFNKRILCGLLLAGIASTAVQAQQSTANARKELESLQQEIKLTERQRRDQRQLLKKADAQLKLADADLAKAADAVAAQQTKLTELKQQQTKLL